MHAAGTHRDGIYEDYCVNDMACVTVPELPKMFQLAFRCWPCLRTIGACVPSQGIDGVVLDVGSDTRIIENMLHIVQLSR